MQHLKLQITGSGEDLEDDKLIEFVLRAENENYKTTVDFWGYADFFQKFAERLEDFPFKSKKDVVLTEGDRDTISQLKMLVRLVDGAGGCEFVIETDDNEGQSVRFVTDVEVSDLQRLAAMLKRADFRNTATKEWIAVSSDLEVPVSELMEAHKHCFKNIDEIRRSAMCGCFHCLYTFRPIEIEEWTDDDKIAICPSCMIDAVIGDASGISLSQDFLKAMYRHYF